VRGSFFEEKTKTKIEIEKKMKKNPALPFFSKIFSPGAFLTVTH